ncbi:MAG: DUF951 domain-containing protein [Clostridia bacterium]|nr:DUF951 domain-containing protein [Clostridia bacterium]
MPNIPVINVGDILELKKPHPCGEKIFTVARIGSDIKLICTGCQRVLMLDRVKVEKMIKKIISSGDNNGK